MAAFDRWGGSWGTSWGTSWTRETAEVVTQTGGHYFPKVKYNDWRERSQKQRREYLERLLSAAEDAPEEIQEEVQAVIAPYQSRGRVAVSTLDVERINRLISRIEAILEDEDETLLLLMTA